MSKNESDNKWDPDLPNRTDVIDKWLRMNHGHDDIFRLEDSVIEINVPIAPTRLEHAQLFHLGQRICFELGIGLVRIVRNPNIGKKIALKFILGAQSDQRWAKRSLNLAIEMLKSHGVNLSKGI